MSQVSLAGFFLGGSFLSMAYYDGYFTIVAVMAVLRDLVSRPALAVAGAAQPDATPRTVPAAPGYATAESRAPLERA
jgi:hypothetical protein